MISDCHGRNAFLLLTVLFLAGFCIASRAAVYSSVSAVPNPTMNNSGFLADPDRTLSQAERTDLTKILHDLETATNVQFAVVILGSIADQAPQDFANRLFSLWGVGQKGKDNGLLLLLVLDSHDWTIEIGYGLEGQLNDAKCGRLARELLVPELKQGRMAAGIARLVRGVSDVLAGRQTAGIDSAEPETAANVIPSRASVPRRMRSSVSGLVSFPGALILLLGGGLTGVLVWIGLLSYPDGGSVPFFLLLSSFSFIGGIFCAGAVFVEMRKALKGRGGPYTKHVLLSESTRFFVPLAWTLPVFLSVLGIVYLVIRHRCRTAPRLSPSGKPMHRLSEKDDDRYLRAGQIVEEGMHSVDYDVWVTDDGAKTLVLAYGKDKRSVCNCPSCSFKTMRRGRTQIIKHATTMETGLAEEEYLCLNCKHQMTKALILPLVSSSEFGGGHSGSDSSSSSSDFGGGSSGGGGASGKW